MLVFMELERLGYSLLRVFGCIVTEHDLSLIGLAAVVCTFGSLITLRLFLRAKSDASRRRLGWLFLTGMAAGGSTWCTHFVAMLGYDVGIAVSYDPLLTGASFFAAIFGTMIGFWVATTKSSRFSIEFGGILVGSAIASMHYIGMSGYQVDGVVTWDRDYVLASVILAMVLGMFSLRLTRSASRVVANYGSVAAMILAIVSLHFTAMTAVTLLPFAGHDDSLQTISSFTLGVSIFGVGLLIVGMGVASYLLDASVQSESSSKLQHMALFDSLTGLPNRVEFAKRLEIATTQCRRAGTSVAFIALDLDRFKEINDQFGHFMGDEVLCVFSKKLTATLTDDEVFARLGGDEFALLKVFSDRSELDECLSRVAEILGSKATVQSIDISLQASTGVAVFPQDAPDAERLAIFADLAMYRAKSDPNLQVSFYDKSLEEIAARKRRLINDLRHAIEHQELDVHYQIQKNISDGSTIGFEALARWTHPELGPISPVEFIPLAEESGLIIPLGEQVLRRACEDASSWPRPYKVAVNISPIQFANENLGIVIEDALWQSMLPATQLQIEITETAFISNIDRTLNMLNEIQRTGVTIAMDDFGTGHSSLANLWAFPFDVLKLDRNFITGLEESTEAKTIVRAVIALGQKLGVRILMEGVETEAQKEFLLHEGCVEVQGFLYGVPLPSDECDFGSAVFEPQQTRSAPALPYWKSG